MSQQGRIMIIDPRKNLKAIKGLSSQIRIDILEILSSGERNINEIAEVLGLPQSTVATNIMILEDAGLIQTEVKKASRGNQKVCSTLFEEFLIAFPPGSTDGNNVIEVEMPVGLFIEYNVSPPCGMCSIEKIIGYLDTPNSFLEPERTKAGLVWFEKGFIKYQFPNNALMKKEPPSRIEVSAELSSEIPGTNPRWLSDITLWINEKEAGTWTSPGDFGDKRGNFTPSWWKLEGSQYGLLKTWIVGANGTFIDGVKVSSLTIDDLDLAAHHSVKVAFGIKENAENVGGINIFGRGFGNYNQDILMRMYF